MCVMETVCSFVKLHCTRVPVLVQEWTISDTQSYEQNLAGQNILDTLMFFICQPMYIVRDSTMKYQQPKTSS